MGVPIVSGANERTLLNLPGFHAGSYVYVYVEDTSDRDLVRVRVLRGHVHVLSAQLRAEHDARDRRLYSGDRARVRRRRARGRANSLHKLETLIAALQVFRAALEDEFEPYDERARRLEALNA